jgi:3-deoxy-D-manno-octulosonic-acid transferase
MIFIYDLFVRLISYLLPIAALFSPKLRLFVDGRKGVIDLLREKIMAEDKTIWIHAASLGEYEQGLPVMEALKSKYPSHKIVLTFFSPSGYEVRKNNNIADVTVYLPLDTRSNARNFLKAVHPDMVLFIKYEYWPNYLKQLQSSKILTYLISGIFRKNQAFFKWYGGFYRNALKAINHFFVQNEVSKELLLGIGFHNTTVSGDTRFDRVAAILEKDNTLDFIESFKSNSTVVVAGSTWPKDEELLSEFINASHGVKFIIAPHNIKPAEIQRFSESLTRRTVIYSDRQGKQLRDYEVFIIDTVGILTKIYSYADIAYVGGGFGNPGVHNILEPATFGVPIVMGPNFSHFAEAVALHSMGGALSVSDSNSLDETLQLLIRNEDERYEKGHICSTFVQMNRNATATIMRHLDDKF